MNDNGSWWKTPVEILLWLLVGGVFLYLFFYFLVVALTLIVAGRLLPPL